MGIWTELPGRSCASLQQELPLRSQAQGLVDPSRAVSVSGAGPGFMTRIRGGARLCPCSTAPIVFHVGPVPGSEAAAPKRGAGSEGFTQWHPMGQEAAAPLEVRPPVVMFGGLRTHLLLRTGAVAEGWCQELGAAQLQLLCVSHRAPKGCSSLGPAPPRVHLTHLPPFPRVSQPANRGQ